MAGPKRASAGLFGDDVPRGELSGLEENQRQLKDLEDKLRKGDIKGETEAGSIVVLQILTIQLSGAPQLMAKATAKMPLLQADGQDKAAALTSRFADSLESIKVGCREAKAERQLEGAVAARGALDDYLALAATKYKLPASSAPPAYSSDPKEFVSQYFGVFSCEGQGLERIPGSNSCKDPPKGQNKNPFPTKKLLDFDFLTGDTQEQVQKKGMKK